MKPPTASPTRPSGVFRFRLLSYLALSVGENVAILTGRPPRMTDFEIPPLVPSGSALQAVTGLGAIVRSHLRLDSVWVRAGLRAALGLGLAILIAELAELQHAFWVVLATLTVLKSNAVSTGYAAWQALAGTLAGFGLASAVVIGVGDAQPALWALLPVCVFLAVYTPTVVHVVVGQAMFTVTIIVLFNLIEPEGWRTGLIRVEDILIGAGTAILVGALLWPRGARAQLRASLASLYETGSAYVRAALAATFDHGSQPAEAAGDARAAGLRAGEALSTYLNEHGPKRLPIEVWTSCWSRASSSTLSATQSSSGQARTAGSSPPRRWLPRFRRKRAGSTTRSTASPMRSRAGTEPSYRRGRTRREPRRSSVPALRRSAETRRVARSRRCSGRRSRASGSRTFALGLRRSRNRLPKSRASPRVRGGAEVLPALRIVGSVRPAAERDDSRQRHRHRAGSRSCEPRRRPAFTFVSWRG